MSVMPLTLEWRDVWIRLALAVVAGFLIGFNRGESGKVAGLRTTMLVCLAACLAMLQVNVLLPQVGKDSGSFVTLDLMRLPLGILSGVGFIGAGAILRKDGLVKGVTTAATLWFVTVVGLCFGGGQLGLGTVGLGLGIFVLWCLKVLETRIPRENQAELTLIYDPDQFSRRALIDSLVQQGCRLTLVAGSSETAAGRIEERFEVRWHASPESGHVPPLLESSAAAGVVEVKWAVAR
ncbi:MgtC/SapB family protein [Paraburkholderia rhizosphaerae]|uniref:Protein MgtC n=1 Tax=Paraburkholderia rhizosphaerae TaxID=480658 RepID=A0A4V3HE27_9BURK|nr:MgtC/SapB family protein [Paraburkholderia rhizosphaerae]TDY43913.1 putative Mg2+ transporter-C (MgtC) family protein [Paraburkholderia rhizosphaerae]